MLSITAIASQPLYSKNLTVIQLPTHWTLDIWIQSLTPRFFFKQIQEKALADNNTNDEDCPTRLSDGPEMMDWVQTEYSNKINLLPYFSCLQLQLVEQCCSQFNDNGGGVK